MATLNGLTIPRTPGFKGEFSVINLSASVTIHANDVLAMDTTTANTVAGQYGATPGQVGLAVIQSTAGSFPVGVAVSDIPPGGQGSMQSDGFIYCVNSAAGAIAVQGVVVPDTAGQIKAAASGGVPGLGVAWSIGSAQGDLVLVQLAISTIGT